jgi:hypothetical protein
MGVNTIYIFGKVRNAFGTDAKGMQRPGLAEQSLKKNRPVKGG